jgi:hypothetical protein
MLVAAIAHFWGCELVKLALAQACLLPKPLPKQVKVKAKGNTYLVIADSLSIGGGRHGWRGAVIVVVVVVVDVVVVEEQWTSR